MNLIIRRHKVVGKVLSYLIDLSGVSFLERLIFPASFFVNRCDDFTIQVIITGDEVPECLTGILVISLVRVCVCLKRVAVFAVDAAVDGDDFTVTALAFVQIESYYRKIINPIILTPAPPISSAFRIASDCLSTRQRTLPRTRFPRPPLFSAEILFSCRS